MRISEIFQEDVSSNINSLFEMANMRQNKTGVPGTIYISTAQASHGPRVKHFANRPGEGVPYFSVSISDDPKIVEIKGLSEREVGVVSDKVKDWVRLNHVALLQFWNDGNTWFDEEVSKFKKSLKKLK